MKKTPARILVPTDFSPASDRALSLAKGVAERFDAEIHLLHVRVVLDDPNVDAAILDEVERILTVAEPTTRQALDQAGENEGAAIHPHMKRGMIPADVIVDAVSEHGCDLVIMGTHGRRGFRHLLAGSVAQEVVHRSPVPVLTTRADGDGLFPPHKILVAIDFSEESFEAVEWAAAVAPVLSAEVTLLHVVQPLIYPAFYALDEPPQDHLEKIMERCHEALTDIATKHLEDVRFETAVVEGYVADGVSRFAEANGFDLVVLATKGLSGFPHTVLGSVAERVVRLSQVPVLTVRGNSSRTR